MRRLITGNSTDALLEQAAAWVMALPQPGEVLILAASRGAADDFVRTQCRRKGAFGLHRYTLNLLAVELAATRLAEKRVGLASELGTTAVIARAISASRSRLRYFAEVAGMPGFTRALAKTAREVRLDEVPANAVRSAGGPAGADLALLLDEYERQLASCSLADWATVYECAIEAATGGAHRLSRLPMMLLAVPIRTAAERKLLAALTARNDCVAVVLDGDAASKRSLQSVLDVPAEPVEEHAQKSIERARQFIFQAESPAAQQSDGSVTLFSAANEGKECVEIARRILAAAAEGIAFDRAAIALRHPLVYQPLVEDALRRAGIPAYFTHGTDRPDPAGRAFLALLCCAEENLSAARFAEYLSFAQVPAPVAAGENGPACPGATGPDGELYNLRTTDSEQSAPEDTAEEEVRDEHSPVVAGTLRTPRDWEKLLVEAAVIGGRDRWERRLNGLTAELKARLKELENEEAGRAAHVQRELVLVENLRGFALPVIGELDDFPAKAKWGEWLALLNHLAVRTLRRADTVLSVLAEMQPLESVGPVDLEEVIEVLRERLGELRVEPPARRYGRVFVATPHELRGRSFSIVFVPGLAEGAFPSRMFEDPLVLDAVRRPVGLRVKDDRVADERLLLQTTVAAASSQLIVSYPRTDAGQGRARVPSFYALEIIRAAEGRIPAVRQLEDRAAADAKAEPGWDAPADPLAAIDETEYDISVIRGLMQPGAGDTRARMAYLLEANEHIARSLRARARRWRSKWTPDDGLVAPSPETLAILASQRLKARAYSASALQQYSACPYRFMLSAIQQLRPREQAEAIERLDPLTRGSLFHEAQYAILDALQRRKLLPVTAKNLQKVLSAADRALDEVAAYFKEQLAPAIESVWLGEIEDVRADIRGWLRDVATEDGAWVPAHFELAFGLRREYTHDHKKPADAVEVLDSVQLRGAIDLVEQRAGSNRLRVVDHKTGKVPDPTPERVGGGAFLQPILYALAAEKLLSAKAELGELYFCTLRGGYRRVSIAINNDSRAVAKSVLDTIDEAVKNGFLPAAPEEGACAYCDFSAVCGPYEETRVAGKQQKQLGALVQLRGLS